MLPAAAYGLAAASLLVAIAAARQQGEHHLALALALMALGGLGLTSTYQSGLTIAGLALLSLPSRAQPEPSAPVRIIQLTAR